MTPRGKRRAEILILVSVFAIPGLVLFPAVHLRTGFIASLKTKSIQFRTAQNQGNSVGLFNSDTPLELTIERFDRIEWREGAGGVSITNPGGQASITFHGGQLRSVDVKQPLDISLEAEDSKLSVAIDPLESHENAIATVLAGSKDRFSCDECVVDGADGTNSVAVPRTWSVYAKKDSRLHLMLRAVKGQIPAEHEIGLAKESAITFQLENQSAIVGPDGELQITSVDRKPLKLKEGQSLVLGELRGYPAEESATIVTLEPAAESVKVDLRGSSGTIFLDKSNEAATLAEYLTSQKPLATYFSTVALIGSTILSILTGLKLIKPKD
jgi:hypothetical protein